MHDDKDRPGGRRNRCRLTQRTSQGRCEEQSAQDHDPPDQLADDLAQDADSQETILNAARCCPVAAIRIKDAATGKQIFPE